MILAENYASKQKMPAQSLDGSYAGFFIQQWWSVRPPRVKEAGSPLGEIEGLSYHSMDIFNANR